MGFVLARNAAMGLSVGHRRLDLLRLKLCELIRIVVGSVGRDAFDRAGRGPGVRADVFQSLYGLGDLRAKLPLVVALCDDIHLNNGPALSVRDRLHIVRRRVAPVLAFLQGSLRFGQRDT